MRPSISVSRWLFITIVVCLTVTPIYAGGAKEAPTAVKDTLVVGIAAMPPTIDFEIAAMPMAFFILANCQEKFVRFNRVQSPVNPDVWVLDYSGFEYDLAESTEWSPDHRTCTFHIRPGCRSASGNEFTSDDVEWNLERGLALHGTMEYFFGVMDITTGMNGFKKIDKYTFSLTSDRPGVVIDMIHSLPVCAYVDSVEAKKHVTDDDPWAMDYLQFHNPSPGPYYVTEWTAGNQVVLLANPNYWAGVPKIKKIIYKVIPESSSRVAMLKDGTIDIAYDMVPREINALKNVPGIKVIQDRGYQLAYLALNNLKCEPFNNKLVRQAINYAINREKIIDMAYYEMAEPFKVIFPAQRPGALDPKEFPYDYNIEKAKQLLAEAGYADGFKVDLYYQSDLPQHETTCVIIKEELAKIGIDVGLRKTPIGALETLVINREIPMAYWRSTPFCPDINYECALMYGKSRKDPGGIADCNYSTLFDPKIEKMLFEGRAIIDPEKRFEYHLDVQRAILEFSLVGWVVQEGYAIAMRDNIKGWNIDIAECCRFDQLEFTDQ